MSEIDLLLERKLQLARELYGCTEEMAKLSYLDQSSQYENLLEKREQYFEAITKTEILITTRLEQKNLSGIKELVDQNNSEFLAIIQKIVALDNKNRITLAAELDKLKSKLNIVRNGKRSNQAYIYNGRVNTAGAYMDSKK